ncbi:MAG: KH domain-containing protein [Halobacteriota archaeon]|jgi:ribosomal RNA assembly protein
MREYLKVPRDRIGVIIGVGGSTKAQIEEKSTVKLDIDSAEGTVTIESDSLGILKATEVINALARGFSPEKAFRIFEDEQITLDIIDLSKVADTPKELKRIMGRIIGKEGKSREALESLTGANVSIYGKTVSTIGYIDQIQTVRTAIEMLAEGAKHAAVYSFLERKRQELKRSQLDYLE